MGGSCIQVASSCIRGPGQACNGFGNCPFSLLVKALIGFF